MKKPESTEEMSIFSLAVTEFLLVMIFILLLILTMYYSKSEEIAATNAARITATEVNEQNLGTLLKEISRILKDIAADLGMGIKDNMTTGEVVEDTRRITGLVKDIFKQIESLKTDWSDAIIIKKNFDMAQAMLEKLKAENEELKNKINELVGQRSLEDDKRQRELEKIYRSIANLAKGLKVALDPDNAASITSKIVEETLEQIGKEISRLLDQLAKRKVQLGNCVVALEGSQEQCGTGHPVCFGRGEWVAHAVLQDDGIYVTPRKSIEGVKEQYKNKKYSYKEFSHIADKYLEDSDKQIPVCRYIMKVSDETTPAMGLYKKYMKAIETRFYKIER